MPYKIEENLKQLCERILSGEISDLSEETLQDIEQLYEEALLASYLRSHRERMESLMNRVGERLSSGVAGQKATPPEPPTEQTRPSEPAEDTRKFSPEVKVLPDPEGPPKPTPRPEYQNTRSGSSGAQARETAPNNGQYAPMNIGLNDRVAFVKLLFQGSQEDYNRVVSQINTMSAYDEAMEFVNEFVKPEYDWSDAEETEQRFVNLIAIRFGA